jgi:hypothetical protein
MTPFELEWVGGPWERRLERRRAGFDDLPWDRASEGASPDELEGARWVWTQSAFSEYASAAAFAEIAGSLLRAGAPLDFVAAAGDFVVEETLHAELSARVVAAFGGAVPLEVDLGRLVRPPESASPLLRAAELLVRTSCVGETLTVPVLKAAAAASASPLVRAVIARIVADESAHAQLGPWFLDWASPRLCDADRAHLGRVAGRAIRAFSSIFSGACTGSAEGVLDCATYDAAFDEALRRRVVQGLSARGIEVPAEDLEALALPASA